MQFSEFSTPQAKSEGVLKFSADVIIFTIQTYNFNQTQRQHFLDGAWVLLYWYLQSPIQTLSNEGSYNLRRILVQKLYPILET